MQNLSKKAVYKSNMKYTTYCSCECSKKDKEQLSINSTKAAKTRRDDNIVPIYKNIILNCLYCNSEIVTHMISHKGYCDKHKKKCKNCDNRHNNAGVSCSIECANELKIKTNLKNSKVDHNLLIRGSRPNQLEFYLKKGYSYEESNKLLSEFQIETNSKSNTTEAKIKAVMTKCNIDNINDYFYILYTKINSYWGKEYLKPYKLIDLLCNNGIIEKFGHKYIYNKLYKIDNEIFNYKIKKRGKKIKRDGCGYGYNFYTEKNELLRSKLEYDFYLLLMKNGINNLIIDKSYPKECGYGNLRYDFYLKDYDIYVEIIGMMNIPAYKEKIDIKKSINLNIHFLQKYKDMLEFIQMIKNIKK